MENELKELNLILQAQVVALRELLAIKDQTIAALKAPTLQYPTYPQYIPHLGGTSIPYQISPFQIPYNPPPFITCGQAGVQGVGLSSQVGGLCQTGGIAGVATEGVFLNRNMN